MSRIIVLCGERNRTSLMEELYSALEGGARPTIVSSLADVDVNSEPVIVCRLSRRRRPGSPALEDSIEQLLLFESAEAPPVVRVDLDIFCDASGETFQDDRTESVVQ